MTSHSNPNNNIEEQVDSPYCSACGGCGFVGCCGIKGFLNNHVVGKTDCLNESMFIHEILDYLEEEDDVSGVTVVQAAKPNLDHQLQVDKDTDVLIKSQCNDPERLSQEIMKETLN